MPSAHFGSIATFTGQVGDSGPIPATGEEDCQSNYFDNDITSSVTGWASSDSNIATVAPDLAHAVSVGQAYSSGSAHVRLFGSRKSCPLGLLALTGLLKVTGPPRIDSLDPTIAMIGSNSVQITINGAGFTTSPTVNLPSGFSQTGFAATDTRIVVTVNISASATVGNNSITVTANGLTSNSATFQVDGPYHMIVQNDITGKCSGCATTVERDVTYQIQNFGGTYAGATSICESPTFSGWNCAQTEGHNYAKCSAPYTTQANGTFTDGWTMKSDTFTPVGCGFNITDHWQWSTHVPLQTLCTLTGYIHTNSILINGVYSPNKMTTGTVCPF